LPPAERTYDSFHDDDPQPSRYSGRASRTRGFAGEKSAVLQDRFNGDKPSARKIETLTLSGD
jgi:hypothetical protein